MEDSTILIAIFLAAAVFVTLFVSWPKRPDPDEGVDVEAEANDAELIGPVTITRQCEYPGTRQPESGKAIARYDTNYSGGARRTTKWILANDMPYMSLSGDHHVLYEYFREDGTLEHDWLIDPEPMLGGGVYVKERLRYFDAEEKLVKHRYLREDGTVGVVMDETTSRFQQFRLDGKTLRFEQLMEDGNRYRQIWYKLDGKTVWMEKDGDGKTHVSFDTTGKPVDLDFTSEPAIGSYGMGPQSEPLLIAYDKYTRKDGTLSYRQTWFDRWDNIAERTAHTLGAVVLYDATGTNPVAEYTLDLRSASQPRFAKQVVLHNADGTTLVRKYRWAECRLSEETIDQQGQVIGHKDYPATDRFHEAVDDIVFQGFTHNVWGTYDDESHDI
jgi:hypothetical protein